MLEYLKKYIDLVLKSAVNVGGEMKGKPDPESLKVTDAMTGLREVATELNGLNARDFEADHQVEFLRVRGNVNHRANMEGSYNQKSIEDPLKPVVAVLDHYRGEGAAGKTRSFAFIADAELRTIIERDYSELTVRVYPSGAWKSTVIATGSILEAILFDRLADPKWNAAALASTKKPNEPFDKWKLEKLIDVAQDIKLLPEDRAKTIHQVLRDYRNFVHPKKEIRAKYSVTEAEAMMSVGALDGVCNHIEANP